MLVHPVVIPGSGTRSWTVLGDDDVPVAPVDRFLAYLTDIGRSPNTVKAYAHDLKDSGQFLGFRGLDWREARLEDIAEFVVWLQLPAAGRAGRGRGAAVVGAGGQRDDRQPQARRGELVLCASGPQRRGAGDLLAAWRTGGRGGWKPFLHHVSKGKPYRGRAITLKAPKKLPRILTVAETQAVLDACTQAAGPLLLRPAARDGLPRGEVLGLRHEDIAAAECEITRRAAGERERRTRQVRDRTVPVGPELIRLYADYLHEEYGDLLAGLRLRQHLGGAEGPGMVLPGRSITSSCGCGRRTGLDFDPHWLRHGAATRWLRDGVSIEVVSKLLGHSSVTVTSSVYGHLTAEDARAALEKAGWFTGREVTW